MDLNIRNGLEGALRICEMIKKSDSILDVGSGGTDHEFLFKLYCDNVYTNDVQNKSSLNYFGDFMDINFEKKFSFIYCSNVLEHIKNIGNFIKKLFSICHSDGFVCIVVPRPHLNKLLSGHISIFTTGTLVYNLVENGIDCKNAMVCNGTYEKTVIVQNNKNKINKISGVIDSLNIKKSFFPWNNICHGCTSILPSINWDEKYSLPKTNKFNKIKN